MSNEVLVAVDGSRKDGRGTAVGMAVAELVDASVHLVRVIPPASGSEMSQARFLGVDPSATSGRIDVEQSLAEIAQRLTGEFGRPVFWEVVENADPATELARLVRARDARALVMGTRAASRAGLALVGSVADRVMRESPKPVVLVPPRASDMEGKQLTIRRVLVPLDGSPLSARAVEYFVGLAGVAKLQYVLVRAVDREDHISALRYLRAIAERFHARGAHAEVRVIESTEPATPIACAARELLVDMIAMSTRGAGGLRRLFLGSVAEGVVHDADVPVLLLTPTMLAEESSDVRDVARTTRVGVA
jgi:nucleotide-binding universal stress UspA family protein